VSSFSVGLIIGSLTLLSTSFAGESTKLPSCDVALKNIYRVAGFGEGSTLPGNAVKNSYNLEELNKVGDQVNQLAKGARLKLPIEQDIEREAMMLLRKTQLADAKAAADEEDLEYLNGIIRKAGIPQLKATNRKLAMRQRLLHEKVAESTRLQSLADQRLSAFTTKHDLALVDASDPEFGFRRFSVPAFTAWSEKLDSPDYFDYRLFSSQIVNFREARTKPDFDGVTIIREQKNRRALEQSIDAMENVQRDFREKLVLRDRLEGLKNYDDKYVEKAEIVGQIQKIDRELAASGTPDQIQAAIKYYDEYARSISLTVLTNKGKVVGAIVEAKPTITEQRDLVARTIRRGFMCTGESVSAALTPDGEFETPEQCAKSKNPQRCKGIFDMNFSDVKAPPPAKYEPAKSTVR
jgi:hypothetical protein